MVFFMYPVDWFSSIWTLIPIFAYSSAGNFASFFEVGAGISLDKRARISWILPVLLLAFAVNVLICSKALLDLVTSRILGAKAHDWEKTVHTGGVRA